MRHVLEQVQGMGLRSTADLTLETVAKFVAVRTQAVSANTIRGELAYLSAACTMAVEEGWLDRAPRFKRLRPRPTKPASPRCHTIEEVGRVLEYLRSRSQTWKGARLHALASTVAYAALRRDEALTLKCVDVSLATSLLTVTDRQRRKTMASAAAVPIAPDLADVLRTWLPKTGSEWLFPGVRRRGPWTGGACGQRACDRLRQAGEQIGIEGMTLASLRHTFATHARRDWGMSDIQLRDVLRHRSVRTQEYYVHLARDEELVRSVERVSYLREKDTSDDELHLPGGRRPEFDNGVDGRCR